MKEIELTNGGKTLVDDEDFDELNKYKRKANIRWLLSFARTRRYCV
ncbi:hypothetical protein [Methanosarcina virus MetMV]|jgi:hypothetical protein|nr:hypothetical protein [Methanosarcina virus MetMV]